MASSDTSPRRHSKERRRSRSTDEAHVFKKPVQFVGRPPVTDHNISDDYMRNPPQNFDPSLAEAWTAEEEGPTERRMRAEERMSANLRASEKEEREEREAREAKEAELEKERSRGKTPGRVRRKEKSRTPARALLPEEVQEGDYQKPSDRVLLPEEETRILD